MVDRFPLGLNVPLPARLPDSRATVPIDAVPADQTTAWGPGSIAPLPLALPPSRLADGGTDRRSAESGPADAALAFALDTQLRQDLLHPELPEWMLLSPLAKKPDESVDAGTNFTLQPSFATSPTVAPVSRSPVTRLPNGEWVISVDPFNWARTSSMLTPLIPAQPRVASGQPIDRSVRLQPTGTSLLDPWVPPFRVDGASGTRFGSPFAPDPLLSDTWPAAEFGLLGALDDVDWIQSDRLRALAEAPAGFDLSSASPSMRRFMLQLASSTSDTEVVTTLSDAQWWLSGDEYKLLEEAAHRQMEEGVTPRFDVPPLSFETPYLARRYAFDDVGRRIAVGPDRPAASATETGPDTEPGAAGDMLAPVADFLESGWDLVSGADRREFDFPSVTALSGKNFFDQLDWSFAQTMTRTDAGLADIIHARHPDAIWGEDKFGNVIVVVDGNPYYLNRPGLDGVDVTRGLVRAATMGWAQAISDPKRGRILSNLAILPPVLEYVEDKISQAYGSNVDVEPLASRVGNTFLSQMFAGWID